MLSSPFGLAGKGRDMLTISLMVNLMVGFMLAYDLPPTYGVTINKSISAERGENINERVYIDFRWVIHAGSALIFRKENGGEIARCFGVKCGQALHNITCDNKMDRKYFMRTNQTCTDSGCLVNLTIISVDQNDSDIYHIELIGTSIRFFTLNLTVQETRPTCTTHLERSEKQLKIMCTWVPQNDYDESRLLIGNRTVYSYRYHGMSNDKLSICNEVSTTVPIDYIFSGYEVPNSCVITQYSIQKRCDFSVFLEPKMSSLEVAECENESTSFVCCTPEERAPSLLLSRNKDILLINASEDSVILDVGGRKDRNKAIFLICSEETSLGFLSHGIGKLIINPRIHAAKSKPRSHGVYTVNLTTHIFLMQSNTMSSTTVARVPDVAGASQCKHPYTIVVAARATVSDSRRCHNHSNEAAFFEETDLLNKTSSNIFEQTFHKKSVTSLSDTSYVMWISVLVISSLALVFSFRANFLLKLRKLSVLPRQKKLDSNSS